MTSRDEVIRQFGQLYLGDSVLERLVLDNVGETCLLEFHSGKLLQSPTSSIFEPLEKFEPALLRFRGVRSFHVEGGPYQLNSTVVGFGAVASEADNHVEFRFDLTGGIDPEAFWATMKIVAERFEFGPRQ
ncbi:MAG TPA: hypothetical protein VLC09_10080 [Polyangiaceae bacterium]|nr:hypothetical protein [Polyangiaceae bacterium]